MSVVWYNDSYMQCVILAGGKGSRLRPLTDSIPKPLVQVAGAPLLDHIVQVIPSVIDELIIVHGYLGEQIQAHCGEEYFGRKVTYVHQTEQKGTGHALWLCKDLIKGRFLYMFADDIHGAADITCVMSYTRAMLTYVTDTPERFGVVIRNPDGTLAEFVEKSTRPLSNLASTGVFVLDEHIFDFPPTVETNDEFYHTDMIQEYAREYPIAVVQQEIWLPVGYPEDITRVAAYIQSQKDIEKSNFDRG